MTETNDRFQQDVIKTSERKPVLVDFWAPWCGPCKALSPIIEKLAKESKGEWRLVKINTDKHPDLAQQYNIRSLPTVAMFVDGEVAERFVGAMPEPHLRQWLDEHLPTRTP